MKFRKQIMAIITVLTVVASILPTGITVSAQGNNELFTEDFESYAVGVISSGAAVDTITGSPPVRNPGRLSYKLSAGDTLEVVEKDGNKALKITIDITDTSTTRAIYLDFDEHYGGSNVYEVGFDYYVENNSVWLPDFGTINDDKQSNAWYVHNTSFCPIKRVSSFSNALYFDGKTETYYGGNLVRSTDAIWRHQKTSIDFTQNQRPFTITTTNAGSGAQLAKKSMTVDTALNDISSILWRFKKHATASWNGQDSGNSVFYIDNVTVKRMELELASTNIVNNGEISGNNPFTMTFSEAVSEASVTLAKNGVQMNSSDYTVTVSGSTVSVVPNSDWENKAVYTVNVGQVTAVSGIPAFSGTIFTLTGSNCLFREDFEGYALGVIATGPFDALDTTLHRGELIYDLLDGDKLEIVEKDGSKVLKLTVGNTSTDQLNAGRLVLDFDKNYGSGKAYEVGFDYYVENHSKYFGEFGSLYDDNESATAKRHNTYYSPLKWTTMYRNDLVFDASTADGKKIASGAISSSDAYWKHQSTSVDFSQSPIPVTVSATKTSDGTLIGNKSVTITKTRGELTADVISGIAWGFSYNNGSNNWRGQDSGNGVYYFDNITVKRIGLELTSTSVPDNGKISASDPFTMTFSGAVTNAPVTLSKDGYEMDSSDYTVTVSGTTVSVVPVDGWYDGAIYAVNVGTVTASGRDPFTGATYTLRGNNSLFSEDFEDYDLGVIATGSADTVTTTRNPGELSYKLVEGDTLEVVEKDGSKVLKLTVNNTDTTDRKLLLDFDQHYGSGKAYDISFDYYVENNSVWFNDFGSVYDDKISGQSAYVHNTYFNPIKVISSYRNNLYFDRVTSPESKYYASGMLAASDAFWKNQSMTIDLSQDPKPVTIKTTKTSDGTKLAKRELTVSQTFGKQTVDNISSIAWGFKRNGDNTGWNGQDEGSGVYYIDNIKVKTVKLALDSSNVVSGDTISIDTDINLKFNAPVSADVADYITITENDEPLSDTEYTVSLSEDGKTVTISSVNGWDYESTYILSINSIETAGFDPFDGAFIEFYTEEYDDTVPPNIVTSTIANGAENVNYRTESVILSTNGVILDETTITKQNIKLYKNGTQINSYSVAPQGNYAVKVSFDGLEKDTSYRITVSGLMSEGTNPLSMTKNYSLDFVAVGDIYADNIALSRTEVNNTFNFSATLHNNTENAQSYQPIVAVKNKSDGKIVALKFATSGTIAAGGSEDISISGINADLDNVDCKLLLWKNISGLEPVTGKRVIKKVKIGTTVIFANNSNIVVADGETCEEETSVSKNAGGFVIPASLASKYLGINSVLTEADIAQKGIGYYVSDKYDFIAVGDNVVFDAEAEENAIKQFGIYVSPTGDDTNSGYSSEPVKTLARAVKIYEGGNKQPILVHGGTYRLSEAVVLKSNSKDGGITIRDFGDGEVILSGAVELPSEEFTTVTDNTVLSKIPSGARSYVKQISLADYIDGEMSEYREYKPQEVSDAYYELFAGDTAQTIARWPNTGFSTTSGVSGNSFTVSSSKASLWKSADNGIIAGYFKYNWAFEDIYINKSSGGSSTITLNSTPKYGLEDGQRFYAMNMLEELDTAGEYYIDNNAKILYYYPTSSFASVNPELSIMDKTDITDTYSKNCLMYIKGVTGVTISGITFDKTRGSGIVTDGGSNISIDGCTLKNIGNTAISLSSSDSEVINSHIYSIGGAGIKAEAGSNSSLTDGNIRIEDNTIHNFGRIFRTYQGAIHLSGCGNTAEYNTIYDAPHCAVRFSGSKHKIKHNIIHDVVKETSDAGAIYAGRDWTSWGTAISSNYFYNIKNNVGDSYTNQAVYIDDLLCGTTVSSNVIKDSDCAALFGGGRGNTFKNNIIANCNVGLKYDNRGENTSASQLVRGQLSDGSDTILEAFVKFLAKDSVIATMEERDAFNGFTKLVDEVNGSNAKLAYPKSAIITGNNFYGSKVNNSGYLDLHEHVTNYGTYSGNNKSTSVPSYDLPECGARN